MDNRVADACLGCGPCQAVVSVIHGNNTGDLFNMTRLAAEPDSPVRYHGQDAALHLAGRTIFLVHYPHYAAAMALTGDYDLVCCGHDHRAAITPVTTIKNSTTLLLNPGTVAGVGAKATYIIGDLETLQFEIRDVPLPGAHTPQPKV